MPTKIIDMILIFCVFNKKTQIFQSSKDSDVGIVTYLYKIEVKTGFVRFKKTHQIFIFLEYV